MDLNFAAQKIHQFFDLKKRMPSYAEMSKIFKFASKKSSFDLAKKLIQLGFLEKDDSGKLVLKNMQIGLPVLGTIPAGFPQVNDAHLWQNVSLTEYLVSNVGKSFLLRVTGDSMVNAGIYQGDMVVIEKDKQPKEGDVVVALIDGEYTLKYYEIREGKACLVPANPMYPVIFPENELMIWGTVVSVMRKYY